MLCCFLNARGMMYEIELISVEIILVIPRTDLNIESEVESEKYLTKRSFG